MQGSDGVFTGHQSYLCCGIYYIAWTHTDTSHTELHNCSFPTVKIYARNKNCQQSSEIELKRQSVCFSTSYTIQVTRVKLVLCYEGSWQQINKIEQRLIHDAENGVTCFEQCSPTSSMNFTLTLEQFKNQDSGTHAKLCIFRKVVQVIFGYGQHCHIYLLCFHYVVGKPLS